ncbi:MAG: site-specific integrase [Chlorobi bacterium]|nr:site-specific integrase [Chlorobiota bacterium]
MSALFRPGTLSGTPGDFAPELVGTFSGIGSTKPRIRKCLNMPWKSTSKPLAMKLLNDQIIIELTPEDKSTDERDLQWLMIEYLKVHSSTLSKARKYLFKNAIRRYVIDNMMLENVTEIRNQILHNMSKSELKTNTIRSHYKALRQIFDYAVTWGYMQLNPLPASLMPKEEVNDVIVLKDGEKETIVKYFRDEFERLKIFKPVSGSQILNNKRNAVAMVEMADLVEFICLVGSRITETLKIKWSDVDSQRITILGKGNHKREFPIKPFPELVALLNKMRTERKSDYLFNWKHSQKPTEKLNKAFKELNIETSGKRGFHILRKTRINELIRKKYSSIAVIAAISGHSIRVLEKYYLEIFGVEKSAAILARSENSN